MAGRRRRWPRGRGEKGWHGSAQCRRPRRERGGTHGAAWSRRRGRGSPRRGGGCVSAPPHEAGGILLGGLIAAAPLRPFFAAPACPPTRGRDNGGPPGPRTLQAEQRSIHAPLPATGCSPQVGHWSKHISIYQRGGGPRLARSRQDASTSGTGTVTLERRWALTGGVCTRAGVGGAFPRRSRQAPPQGGGRPGKRRPTSARARIPRTGEQISRAPNWGSSGHELLP